MNTQPHYSSVSRRGLRHARAFTLVELLVVIAIIGVLAAILIPVTSRVRQSARDSKCAATIRQFAVATQLYVSDNRGKLPPTAWRRLDGQSGNYGHYHLIGYFSTPVTGGDRITAYSCRLEKAEGGEDWLYGLNTNISELPAVSITQPTRQILATCSTSGYLDGGNTSLRPTPKPHSGKVSVVRLDGGVSREYVSTLLQADVRRDTPAYRVSDETTYFLGGDPQWDK